MASSEEYELMLYQKKRYKRTAIRSSAIFVTNLEQLLVGGKGKINITINTTTAQYQTKNLTYIFLVTWKMLMVMMIVMRKNTKRVFVGKVEI